MTRGGVSRHWVDEFVMKYLIHDGVKYYRESDVKELTLFLGTTIERALLKFKSGRRGNPNTQRRGDTATSKGETKPARDCRS